MDAYDDLDGPVDPLEEERSYRRKAMYRSWFCPGAGYALVGLKTAGLVTFLATLGVQPAFAWVALDPQAVSAWTALGLFAFAAIMSLAEQVACKRATLRPPGPTFLVKVFPVAGILLWGAIGGGLFMLITAFGSVRFAGDGMSPTFDKGELLLYCKRRDPDPLPRGTVLSYRLSETTGWGRPGMLTVSRILAVPGDTLAIRGGVYVVNGKPGPVAPPPPPVPVISVPTEPDVLTVPEGRYFVVQDHPSAYDSQVLSWVEADKVVSDRFYYFRKGTFLHLVK
jgi:signal peptidase I